MHQHSCSETLLNSQPVFDGRLFQVRVDSVRLRNGKETNREVVDHSPSVAVVPVDACDNVLLVRQYRYSVDEFLLELPAGGVEPGETPEEAAQRELKEEIGYGSGCLRRLGEFWISPGYCTELMYAYLANDLQSTILPSDWDEDIKVEKMPVAEAIELINCGEIRDSKTIAVLLMSLQCLKLN